MSGRFKLLEHTSDIYVEGYGRDLIEAISSCVEGMLAIVLQNYESVSEKEKREFTIEAFDFQELIYLTLEQVLFLLDSESFLSKALEGKIEKNEKLKLEGYLMGEKFDPSRHIPKTHIKGVTFHDLTVNFNEKGVTIKVLLDI